METTEPDNRFEVFYPAYDNSFDATGDFKGYLKKTEETTKMVVKDFEGREWDLLQGDDVQHCLDSIGYEGAFSPNYLFVLGDCIANGEYGTVYGSQTANLSDTVLQLN